MNGQNNKNLVKKIASFTGIAGMSTFLCLPAVALNNPNSECNKATSQLISQTRMDSGSTGTDNRGTTNPSNNDSKPMNNTGTGNNPGTGNPPSTQMDKQPRPEGQQNNNMNPSDRMDVNQNQMDMNNTADPAAPAASPTDAEGNSNTPDRQGSGGTSTTYPDGSSNTGTPNYSSNDSSAPVRGMW